MSESPQNLTTCSWNGARWWKFDFHTHTPASNDYGKGPNQATLRSRTPRQWLLDYMLAGIDCIAIADHNSGGWIDKLKEALAELEFEKPEGFRPIYLFPSLEISAYGGIHLLAIFDIAKTTSDIDSLLGAVGFPTDKKGTSDAVTTKSFTEVARAVEEMGGIAIPAHVDCENGLFKLQGATVGQALDCSFILAIEVVDSSSAKPSLYHQKKLRWTEVLGSDSHHPMGQAGQQYPGSRFTWVKMGTPCLEGLRLALLDGPLSVRRADQVADDPNTDAALVIEAIEITQARYMGRSGPFKLELHPWLNAIIGGRGTGKSTLVEFLRLALRREKEIPEALSKDFEKYGRVYQNRDDDGLLTPHSRLVVRYRKDRTRFRIQWSQAGDAEPIEVQEVNGEWKMDQGDVAQRFPVRIYSQKQIFELAKAPLALLHIVDEAPEVDRLSWDDRWKEEEAHFLATGAKAREIEAGLADEPRLRGELEDVKRRLEIFEQAGHADVLKEYQTRLRQQHGVGEWEQRWSVMGDRLRQLADELILESLDPSLFDSDRAQDKEILHTATVPLARLEAIRGRLVELAEEADQALNQWRQARAESAWQLAVRHAIEGYDELRQRLEAEKAGSPSAYADVVQRRQMLESRLTELESRRKQLESLRKDARESIERLRELRRDLTEKRRNFLARVLANNPYVRIDVLPYGARETVEPEFRRLIQREQGSFERDIEGLLETLYVDGTNGQAFEERLDTLKQKVRDIADGRNDAGKLSDRRFATHLAGLPPEAFDRLDTWFPEDSLRVQYSTTGDGSGFRSIQEGSPGQKTAALLAFLFSYGEEPIILDQPEDDLDNYLIYGLIVGQLRRIKLRRQVIVVTHNPNVVVNGDAELVVALAPRNGETHQECVGCLQERKVRDMICVVMEGGREALEQRYRRIALE